MLNTVVANYLEEVPIRPDTELFLKKYRPEAVSSARTFKTFSINGGPLNDGPISPENATAGQSREANLDVQAIAGISWNTPIVSYSTGGRPPSIPDLTVVENDSEPYLVWVNWLLQQRNIPPIISTSYGEPEQVRNVGEQNGRPSLPQCLKRSIFSNEGWVF